MLIFVVQATAERREAREAPVRAQHEQQPAATARCNAKQHGGRYTRTPLTALAATSPLVMKERRGSAPQAGLIVASMQ